MAPTDLGIDLSRYKLGWSDAEDYVYKPTKGLSALAPKYSFATSERVKSRNDHVPTVRSRLRLPLKYSSSSPTVLTPPILMPKRTPSSSAES